MASGPSLVKRLLIWLAAMSVSGCILADVEVFPKGEDVGPEFAYTAYGAEPNHGALRIRFAPQGEGLYSVTMTWHDVDASGIAEPVSEPEQGLAVFQRVGARSGNPVYLVHMRDPLKLDLQGPVSTATTLLSLGPDGSGLAGTVRCDDPKTADLAMRLGMKMTCFTELFGTAPSSPEKHYFSVLQPSSGPQVADFWRLALDAGLVSWEGELEFSLLSDI